MTFSAQRKQHWQSLVNAQNAHTPFILTDLDVIRKNCRDFQRLFPNIKLFYAIKAYSDAEVIRTANEFVEGFDVASLTEIKLLLSLGIEPHRIAYNNPVKAPESIQSAYELGVRKFAFQSYQEAEKIATYAPGVNVYARVKMDDSHSAVPLSTKYGAKIENVIPLLLFAQKSGLHPVGITFHVGSQQTSKDVWIRDIATATTIMHSAHELDLEVSIMNIGGGFPAKYNVTDPDIEEIAETINTNVEFNENITYIAEPGRYIVADSSAIVTTVIGREHRDNKEWLYLDVGLFQAFIGAQRFKPFPYLPYALKHNYEEGVTYKTYVLTGPSCDSQDIIMEQAHLPIDLELGDKIIFPMTGAYTTVYGSNFNGFEPPKRVFINNKDDI